MIKPHPGQQAVLDSTARHKIVVTARRWGKSELVREMIERAPAQYDRVAYYAPYAVGVNTVERVPASCNRYLVVNQDYRSLPGRVGRILTIVEEPALFDLSETGYWGADNLLIIGSPLGPFSQGFRALVNGMGRFGNAAMFLNNPMMDNPSVPRYAVEALYYQLSYEQFMGEVIGRWA